MKIYVEMDELQLEKYKESLRKPKQLTDYESKELAEALLEVIQKEGGRIDDSNPIYDPTVLARKIVTVAKINKKDCVISLIIEKNEIR